MKGSLAAMIAAAKTIFDSGITLSGDLILTFVADEEFGSIGTEDILKRIRADAAVVTEPTDLKISRAHRGFIWYEVETFGVAAHGSRFDEGVDANIRMGRFLSRLDKLEKDLRQRSPHPLAGPPSLHAPRIHGGTEISTYADHCFLEIERRTIPGENPESITAEFQEIINVLSDEDSSFKATVTPKFIRDPFEIGKDAEIVRTLETVLIKKFGMEPIHSGQSYWTDASLIASKGVETVLIGPSGSGLHSKEEWVELDSVVNLATILAETANKYINSEW
jgi:acetylornithine deacetylase